MLTFTCALNRILNLLARDATSKRNGWSAVRIQGGNINKNFTNGNAE